MLVLEWKGGKSLFLDLLGEDDPLIECRFNASLRIKAAMLLQLWRMA